uniref:Uncharacterized protein n=1 Tax=Oryza rufipogon TaxID=4529 RepID=A0A0E0PJL9_ORYRU
MNRKWMYKYSCATPNLHKLHALDVSRTNRGVYSLRSQSRLSEGCIPCGLNLDFRGVYSSVSVQTSDLWMAEMLLLVSSYYLCFLGTRILQQLNAGKLLRVVRSA